MNAGFQGVFIIGGIAIIVTGLANANRNLVVLGSALIVLGILGRIFRR